MYVQASIELSHTERWALERGELPAPSEIADYLRTDAYEVSVVDQLHRIARRFFERNGYRSVWERPFRTGLRGHPSSVDVAAFNSATRTELRIELGTYSRSKLRKEAEKLAYLTSETITECPNVVNLLLLWKMDKTKLTRAKAKHELERFANDALLVSGDSHTVKVWLSSSADLFQAEDRQHRKVTVGLFQVV